MKRGEKGYTFVELLVVTAIIALIANGTMISIFNVLGNTSKNRNQMNAVSQVENAGYWISLDAERAQTVEAEGLGSSGRVFTISWNQSETGTLEETGQYIDILYFAFSGDSGGSWSNWYTAFTGDNPPSSFSYTIPDDYLTSSFLTRFYLNGPGGWTGTGPNECAYLDNIAITEALFSDDCSSLANWTNGADWSISSGELRGHHYADPPSNRYLTMSTGLDLSSYQGETVTILWDQRTAGGIDPTDGLYFAFSGDDGETWSNNIEAFHSYPPSSFNDPIPDQYLTAEFKVRFYLDNFGASDEYLYLDDIAISVSMFSDSCSGFSNWTNGADWGISSGQFLGHHYGGSDSERYLTMSNVLDLTPMIYAEGFPITFTWTTWDATGGTEYQATYTLQDGRVMRSFSVGGGASTETFIAQYIDPYGSSCQFASGRLMFTLKATVGGGPSEISETRQFQILTRPTS